MDAYRRKVRIALRFENYPATVNPNVTRSLLYTFEPITHTGVRATYAESQQLSFVVGIDNGLTGQADESASGADRLVELSMNLAPASKLLSWSLQGYYGRDITDYGSESATPVHRKARGGEPGLI